MQKVSSKNSSLLKGKRVQCPEYLDADCFDYEDLKSAVAGLIKFHEDRIEELIKLIETSEANFEEVNITLNLIKFEYESIMAIEHWLEDVI